MKLSKRIAAKLKKENFAEIAEHLGLTRAAPSIWLKNGAIPDWHIDKLSDYLGYKVK